MLINKENFGFVISKMVRLVGEYGAMDQTCYDNRIICFDKTNRKMEMISPCYIMILENVDIDLPIEEPNNCYNVMLQRWQQMPERIDVAKKNNKVREEFEKLKLIGRTSFYANNIMKVMDLQKRYVDSEQARYIFVHGFLPDETCAPMTFVIENGKPIRRMKSGKAFVVNGNSPIPEEAIKAGDTYAVKPVGKDGSNIIVDVLCRFGKTRSGLLVSPRLFTSDKLALANKLEIIHPELTECSNFLELEEGYSQMPPIHFKAKLLYNVLKVFNLAQSSKVIMNFQEEIASPVLLTNEPQGKDDIIITCLLAPLSLNSRVSMC